MGTILDSLDLVSERMQQEQSDLKAVIKERMQINVTDTEIKDSVDRLIYNHCLKKKELQELGCQNLHLVKGIHISMHFYNKLWILLLK